MATVSRPKKKGFCEKSSLTVTNFLRMSSLVLAKMALRGRAPPLKKTEYKPQPESQPELHSSTYVKVVDAARGRDGEVDAWATAYISRVRAERKNALHVGSASAELFPPPILPPKPPSRQIVIT